MTSEEIAKKYGGLSTSSTTVRNQPKRSTARNIGQALLGAGKGVVNTIRGAADLGESILNPIANKLTGSQPQGKSTSIIPKAAYTPSNTPQRVGFALEQIAELAVPATKITKIGKAAQSVVSGASKLSKSAGFAARSLVEGAGAAGLTKIQGGDTKTAGIVGAAFPVAGAGVKVLGSAAKNVAKYLSSSLSGVPEAAIEQAFKNPEVVQRAIIRASTEGGDIAAQGIYNQALNALNILKRKRAAFYKQGLEALDKSLSYTKKGELYVKRVMTGSEAATTKGYVPGTKVGVPTKLGTSGLKNVATRTLKEFGAKAKGKAIDFSEVAIDKSYTKKIEEVVDRIYTWKNNTPSGLNQLRRVIDSYQTGNFYGTASENQFNAILSSFRKNLGDYIGERVPEVKKLNQEYAKQSEVIDKIIEQLKLGKGDPNTALRKLVNVFNPKSQVYRPIVQELDENAGVDLMSDIAGLTMAQWTPQGVGKYLAGLIQGGLGIGSVFNPSLYPAVVGSAVMSSPRMIGKAVTGAGKIAPQTKKAFSKLGQGIKATAIQQFSDR